MYTEPGINFTYTNAAILFDLCTLVIPPYPAVSSLRFWGGRQQGQLSGMWYDMLYSCCICNSIMW